jgi:hypothetical protein
MRHYIPRKLGSGDMDYAFGRSQNWQTLKTRGMQRCIENSYRMQRSQPKTASTGESTGEAMSADAQMVIKSERAPARRRYERYFFSAMAALILATVFLGFAKSYFLAGMFRAPLPNWVIHVHGAAFALWIVFLVVQMSLVSAGHVDIHRRLGIFVFGLACAMVILGAMAATDLLRRGVAAQSVDAKTFYASSLGDIVVFGTLIFFAFRARSNPAAHKRLILIATITLLAAAINRWPFPIILREPILIVLIDDAFLLPMVAYDLWSMRKVHQATLWGGLFLVIMQQLELPIGSTAVWQSFATWVLERIKTFGGS